MKKSPEIKLNFNVLKALRETSGYTIEEVAKKLNVNVEKVIATEKGISSFSLTQIKKLANIYHRSLAAFFTDTLPAMPDVPDYRINREKRLTPEVYASERRAYYLSKKLSEITGIKSQIPIFNDALKPEELAYQFRKYLGVDLLKSTGPSELLAYYKQILEEKLLILIIELPLKADDVRGFSIFSNVSVIVLNENDAFPVKLFSLFHEVCHLLKRISGICSMEIEQGGENIERECNSFSAEFLVPLDDLETECKKFSSFNKDVITELYKIYGVSKQVLMLRLLRTGFIDKKTYEKFKKEGEEKIIEIKEKTFGRKNWEKTFQNRIGNLAIREIRNSYQAGKISYSEVFDIFNMKTKYIEKFIYG